MECDEEKATKRSEPTLSCVDEIPSVNWNSLNAELLTALEWVVAAHGSSGEAWCAARKAIAKAKQAA